MIAEKITYPAVSVIIPMYNAGKYIGACLHSLLAQNLKDFEAIIVDDCSTDNSVDLVKNYVPKFDGRLRLVHMETNSGGGGMPRNKGLELASGEYIFFLDADDMLKPDALQEMYTLAKDYSAEVVYCEKNLEANENLTDIHVTSHQSGSLVDKPTFQSEDLQERVEEILQRDIWGTPWSKLVQREFLVKNEILFPNLRPCQDYLWTLTLFFTSKKFLRVPNATYLWRQTETSITREKRTPQQNIAFWLNPVIFGLKWLDTMLSRLEFFRGNFQSRYAILDFVVRKMISIDFSKGLSVEPFTICAELQRRFGKNLGEYDVLIPILLTAFHNYQKIILVNRYQLEQAQKRITELEKELATVD